MLHFIMGPPSSGKSQYAEGLVGSRAGKTVYVGTLPCNSYYEKTIYIHRQRRPPTWGLIELIGDPEADLELVSDALDESQNMLIDGLAFYILRMITVFDNGIRMARNFTRVFINRAAYCGAQVFVIDPPVPRHASLVEQSPIRHAHTLMASKAESITLVNGARVTPLTYDDVLRIDRGEAFATFDDRLAQMLERR